MDIKNKNIEFTSFSDGVCDIYSENEYGEKQYKYRSLVFDNRTLGYNRYFVAKSVNVQVNRVIRIPQITGIDNYDMIEIRGFGIYRIEMIQMIYNTNPLSMDLTLKQLEIWGK